MGSIGPAEILVVLVVALIVLGPNRLPDAARSVGKAVSEFRRMTTGFQSEVKEAFADKPPTYPRSPSPGPGAEPGSQPAAEPGPVVLPERPQDAELPAEPSELPVEPSAADRPVN